MQDFVDQAFKNGVQLSDKGNCDFCGADFPRGIFDCVNYCNTIIENIDLKNPTHLIFRFLIVDSHALQHPEIHGTWSNHFHLTRMHLILEKKKNWTHKTSPLLSHYLNNYKTLKPHEYLHPPAPLKRGQITTNDFAIVKTAAACMPLIKRWAEEVYMAWKDHHCKIAPIAEGFLKRADHR